MVTAASAMPMALAETQGSGFIQQFLTKTLRITVTDERVFVGQLKCADKDCNLVLSLTHEYRPPPEKDIASAAANVANKEAEGAMSTDGKAQIQFTSRFVGLVVIPGDSISKIELEEQMPP